MERLKERFDTQQQKDREESPTNTSSVVSDTVTHASPEVRRWVREYRKGGGYVSSWHEDGKRGYGYVFVLLAFCLFALRFLLHHLLFVVTYYFWS